MPPAPHSPQHGPPLEEPPNETVARVAAVLAAGMGAGATVEALGATLAALGLSRAAVRAAWRLVQYSAKVPPGSRGAAGRAVARSAPVYRALYVVNAARRLEAGRRADDPGAAVRRERGYLKLHTRAARRRVDAAREVDSVVSISEKLGAGSVFKWIYVSEPGAECTPIRGRYCRALHDTVWPVSAPPDGTFPGLRHPGCKCRASAVSGNAVYQGVSS